MGLNLPNPPHNQDLLQTTVSAMKQTFTSVLAIVPISSKQNGQLVSFDKTDSGEYLYKQFIEEFQPRLIEDKLDGANPHHLTVMRPARDGDTDDKPSMIVGSTNYFFRRGAQNTNHPAWKGKGGINSGTDGAGGNWLQDHRGESFVKELRASLRTYCKFQQHNHELINGFVQFCAEMLTNHPEQVLGFSDGLVRDMGLPAGLAERLLDFFYLGIVAPSTNNEESDLAQQLFKGFRDADLIAEMRDGGGHRWTTDAMVANFKGSFTKLALNFRRGLLGQSFGMTDCAQIEDLFVASLDDQDLNQANFKSACDALTIIREILPARALPQEAVAWLLEGLFVEVTGKKDLLFQRDYNNVANAICNGHGGNVAKPTSPVLTADIREQWKTSLLSNLDELVNMLTETQADRTKIEKWFKEGGMDILDADLTVILDFAKLLVPNQAGDAKIRQSMIRAAKSLLANELRGRVLPKLFGSPVLDSDEFLSRILGDNLGLVLQASGVDDKAAEALEQVAKEMKPRVADIAGGENDRGKLEALKGLNAQVLVSSIQALAANSERLKELIHLFLVAYRLMKAGTPASSETLVSSQLCLRPRDVGQTALGKSPVAVGPAVIRAAVDAHLKLYGKLRAVKVKLNESVEAKPADSGAAGSVKKNARKAAAQKQQAKAVTASVSDPEPGDPATDAKQEEQTAPPPLSKEDKKKLEEHFQSLQKTFQDSLGGTDAGQDDLDSKIAKLLEKEGLTTKAEVDLTDEKEDAIKKVLEKFLKQPDTKASVESLLTAWESLNHEVYRKYEQAFADTNRISFCRQVEAMTLGRIFLAEKERCRLTAEGSGLIKLVCDLIQETGSNAVDGQTVTAIELLKSHSLYEYLDGGFLQTGADVSALKNQLKSAAKQTLTNIQEFIGELQGIRYLFEKAPANATIHIFNGTAEQFATWLAADLANSPLMGHNRPFSIRAPRVLPGLIYIAKSAGTMLNLRNPPDGQTLLRSAAFGYTLPPVVTSSAFAADGAPFHHISVGPDFPLNPKSDHMPTKLPAPYPVLVAFLNSKGQTSKGQNQFAANTGLDPNSDGNRVVIAEGFNIAGNNAGVDAALAAVFGQEFQAHYHLCSWLRIYAEAFVQNGCVLGPWLMDGNFSSFWWADGGALGLNSDLDKPAGGGISVKECFWDKSAQAMRFSGDIGTAILEFANGERNALKKPNDANDANDSKALKIERENGEDIISLPDWLEKAIKFFC